MDVNEADKTTYKSTYGTIAEQKSAHSFIDSIAEKCRKISSL
jgi:hypothetical protein